MNEGRCWPHRQWVDIVDWCRNTEVVDRTNLPSVRDVIARRRNSLFSHVVRLDDHTPAHRTLSQVTAARTVHRFGPGWRIQQIGDGTPFSIRGEWSKARRRGHSWVDATDLCCLRDLMMMMMMMMTGAKREFEPSCFTQHWTNHHHDWSSSSVINQSTSSSSFLACITGMHVTCSQRPSERLILTHVTVNVSLWNLRSSMTDCLHPSNATTSNPGGLFPQKQMKGDN